MSVKTSVMVFIEQKNKTIADVSLELLCKAKELADANGWFLARQFESADNAKVHENTTGREILADFAGDVGDSKVYLQAVGDSIDIILFGDDLGMQNGPQISPRMYREFALPYEQEVIRFWHRYDLDVILHICGDTELIIDDMPETGADLVSIDRIVLEDAVRRVGERVRVIGNFGTSDIWLGSAAEIESAVEAMVAANRSCPMGYVASTGCEVPVETPPENVDAFVRAARGAGLNPDFGLVSDRIHA